MDCKETRRCIRFFLKDEMDDNTAYEFVEHIHSCNECMEELTVEYLLFEGIRRLENADDIDVKSELEEKLNRILKQKKMKEQLKAGLFLVVAVFACILLLGGI